MKIFNYSEKSNFFMVSNVLRYFFSLGLGLLVCF